MPLIGLIGYPLAHSFSPGYFKKKFSELHLHSWDYKVFPLKNISELPKLLQTEEDLIAINVTIPYKESVLAYCRGQEEEVMAIGAANLLLRNYAQGDSLMAFNTDHYGFSSSIKTWYYGTKNKALILGNGGASKAIQYALKNMFIGFDIVGRHSRLEYSELNLSGYDLIINCTPVGMQGYNSDSGFLPLRYETIGEGTHYYDLVYNPEVTDMMKLFLQRGCKVKNGEEMLRNQADRAWEIIQEKL